MADSRGAFRRSRAVVGGASPAGWRERGEACSDFRIGTGLGGPAYIDYLLLLDPDLLRDVVPLSCRGIEDRLWIIACPELRNRLAHDLLVLVGLQERQIE